MPSSSSSTKKSKGAVAKFSFLSAQTELHRSTLSWEQMCFLTHNANFSKNYDSLLESFNGQFKTSRSLDTIDVFLRHCSDADFLMMSEDAEHYKAWYIDHPTKAVHPIYLLASKSMRVELRAYLAYHHSRNMGAADLRTNLNSTFPTEARSSKEIAAQLEVFRKKNHLRVSLSNFASRYPWHPEYDETITPGNGVAPNIKNKSAAKARLGKDKKKAKVLQRDPAAEAEQNQLLGQRAESSRRPSAAQTKPAGQRGEAEEGPSATQTTPAGNDTDPSDNANPGLGPRFPATTGAITSRPGHAKGRARSASPGREEVRGNGRAKRVRRRSL